ncbi:MAG: hypothetical protein JWL76_1878 [Thermoleophilia bacterium]|nr:hypothetical protein [Thermoleophilia bacterium]
MATVAGDGGGGAVKPTVTTTSGNTSTGKSRVSTPALSLTKPGAKPAGTTIFNRRPVVDDNLSLRDAVRTAKKHPPTAPSKPAPSRPEKTSVKPPSKPRVKSPASAPSENDGRAAHLNSGSNVGSRDKRIAALKEAKTKLEGEEVKIESQIENLEDEIEGDETKSSIVKTGIGIATAPVGALFGAFGKSNPVADAAGAVTEKVLGLEGDRTELKAQEKELDTQQAEIEAEIKKLENEQVLNFLADTAHVTDMDKKVVNFIEDGETKVGDLDVKLNVADETGTGSDGVFDSGTNAITVDSEILADAKENMDKLKAQGVVDGDGNIVDAAAFDRSSAGDDTIKSVSLLAVHELNHATQHAKGEFNSAFESARSIVDKAIDTVAPGTALQAAGNILNAAAAKGEEVRTQAIEVESYRLQEQNDLKAGATKKAFITIDKNGAPLPEEQQLANVLAYQEGTPLVYGPTVGYVREQAGGAAQDHDHDGDGATDGNHTEDHVAEGYKGPGYKGPGDVADGEIAEGYKGPGYKGPGYLALGNVAEGYKGPGYKGPGEVADGEIAEGYKGPGYKGPGFLAMGFLANGFLGEGYKGPGYKGPGYEAEGFVGEGYKGPGYKGPGYEAAGYLALGYIGEGYKGPGYKGPGFEAAGFVGEGYKGPGYKGPGYKGPGYKGPGEVAD